MVAFNLLQNRYYKKNRGETQFETYTKWKWRNYRYYKNITSIIQTQFDAKIRVLWSDDEREYVDKNFQEYITKNWDCESTNMCKYTSAKRHCWEENRHLLEVTRSLMFTKRVSKQHWQDAVLTAALLINQMPSNVLVLKLLFPCVPQHWL